MASSEDEDEVRQECSRQLEKLMKLMVNYYSDAPDDDRTTQVVREEINQAMSDLFKFDLLVINLSSYFISKLFRGPREIYSLEETFEMLHELGRKSQLIELQKNTEYRDKLMIFFDPRDGQLSCLYQSKSKFNDGDQDLMIGIAKKKYGDKFTKFAGRWLLVANWNPMMKRWRLDKIYCYSSQGLVVLAL